MANEFIIRKGFKSLQDSQITGSLNLSGDLEVLGSISGDITGSASTASYIELSNVDGSASLASRITSNSSSIASLETVSGSYANSSSFASDISSNSSSIGSLNAVSSSYLLNTTDTLTGDLTVTGNIIATTLNVQDVTASVVYSSGSNIFGSSSIDTQQFTGSILTSGSIEVNGDKFTVSGATGGTNIAGTTVINDTLYLTEYIQHLGNTSNNIRFTTDAIAISANATFAGDVSLADNKKIKLGAGNDLEIYSNGSVGVLKGNDVRLANSSGDNIFRVNGDVAELYHNDSKKFETLSDGAKVHGIFYIDDYITHTGDGDTSIQFQADRQTYLAGGDEFIDFREATESYITLGNSNDTDTRMQGGAGYIFIQGSNGYIGINDSTPSYPFEVNANTYIGGTLQTSGNATFNGNVKINTTSSALGKLAVKSDSGANTFYNNIQCIPSDATTGGLFIGSNVSNDAIMVTGAYYANAGNYTPTATSASIINMFSGNIVFRTNDSLTVGTNYVPTERMRITSSGVVQIGATTGYTTISQGAFFTKGGGDMYTANLLAGAAVSPMFKLQRNDVEKYNIGLDGSDNLAFINASGDAKMSIDSSGNTTFAGEISSGNDININNGKLVVYHSSAEVRIKSTSDTGESYISFSDPSDINPGQIYYGHTTNRMAFRTNDDERMAITSGGDVGIGTSDNTATDINARLHVYKQATANTVQELLRLDCGENNHRIGVGGAIVFRDIDVYTDTAKIIAQRVANSSGSTLQFQLRGSEKMRITSQGDIQVTGGSFYNESSGITYIGRNSEFEFVDALASATKRFRPGVDNSFDLGDSSRRWDDVWATNPTIQTSDKNEKNTIKDTDLGLDFINKLKPVSYKWNNKTRTHYGLIAQDVEDLLDEINKDTKDFAGFIKADVSEEKDNTKHSYGLRYNEFISPMIKAIQELKAEIEILKNK